MRLIDLKSSEFKVVEQIPVGNPISSISFSPNYRHIAVATNKVGSQRMPQDRSTLLLYSNQRPGKKGDSGSKQNSYRKDN